MDINFFKKNNLNYHYFFLVILSLNYILPLLIFNNITLFYIDSLDSEIVYNSVIGKILKGNEESISVFLGGEIRPEYLRRMFHPYMFLYSYFNAELAYWIVDVLIKLTSYFSFFILAKKINKNLFICGLISCLYASSNLPTHESFGLAIFPYISYLILYKNSVKLKHIFIIIFFGLNSDLVVTGISLFAFTVFYLFYLKKEKYIYFAKLFALFSISILIANWNIIFTAFQPEQLHRVEFLRDSLTLRETIIYFFTYLFQIPTSINSAILIDLPYALFILPLMIGIFFSKGKKFKLPLYIIILMTFFLAILKYELIAEYINISENLFKTVSWGYLGRSFVFLFAFSLIHNLKKINFYSKILISFVFTSILLFQINSSVVPIIKDKFLKINNYQNFYTFKGYYYFYDYPLIKKIVQNERTISVGLDPMVAVWHGIKVIDGYHNVYPLTYKYKFRKIIEKELDSNMKFRKYYDDWGCRVYSTFFHASDVNNIKINFREAKKIGADFVISKYLLKSNDLSLITNDCIDKGICLYKIN